MLDAKTQTIFARIGGSMVLKVFLSMVGWFVFVFVMNPVMNIMDPPRVNVTNLNVVYSGMVYVTGIIVGCTVYIVKAIRKE